MTQHTIAVIAGDGIGTEVMPEGLRVLNVAAERFGIDLVYKHFDWASWPYYERHGKMLPDDWKAQLADVDAIFFGAVGWPEKIPDHVSLWGSLLQFRREFDQYINLRPAKLLPGVIAPVVRPDGSPREPGEIDMMIVRENTEGEYSSIGGRMYAGTPREIVMQETVMSRYGVDRVLFFAFELAQKRGAKHLTSATKSNGIAITMPYWDERFAAMAARFSPAASPPGGGFSISRKSCPLAPLRALRWKPLRHPLAPRAVERRIFPPHQRNGAWCCGLPMARCGKCSAALAVPRWTKKPLR